MLADAMNNNDEAVRIVFDRLAQNVVERAKEKGQLSLLG